MIVACEMHACLLGGSRSMLPPPPPPPPPLPPRKFLNLDPLKMATAESAWSALFIAFGEVSKKVLCT